MNSENSPSSKDSTSTGLKHEQYDFSARVASCDSYRGRLPDSEGRPLSAPGCILGSGGFFGSSAHLRISSRVHFRHRHECPTGACPHEQGDRSNDRALLCCQFVRGCIFGAKDSLSFLAACACIVSFQAQMWEKESALGWRPRLSWPKVPPHQAPAAADQGRSGENG